MSDREDLDLTALVSSLVQLILDEHCRTVEGFQDLIDREWTALGHPWLSRYNASSSDKVISLSLSWQFASQSASCAESVALMIAMLSLVH